MPASSEASPAPSPVTVTAPISTTDPHHDRFSVAAADEDGNVVIDMGEQGTPCVLARQ